ncbi:MAG: YraN family protein [Gammaproteobacteria bacterium]|uniref:UPF0102 protein H8D24_05885 n=1 Tax=Candidatus Thiopontia autotrophica TaxID=2841688 RepID=A0A8J6TXN2_9GAMM|nr:YraN family protein [Candidatus Thiopontia autotrophica]
MAGHDAEMAVSEFLQQSGLIPITSNYSCKAGEIDLIMRSDQSTIIFVEVRLRNNRDYGSGADTVTSAKQHKLSRTALHYLQRNPQYEEWSIRFDVVSVIREQDHYKFSWIEEAFWPGDN